MIDITMVATLRPDILRRTLKSWCRNMFTDRDRYRLILHIDAIGEDCEPSDVLKVAKHYFSNIKYNISFTEFSHAKAFKWCWDQVESGYVMHVDDDWELVKEVNIDDLIKIHNEIGNLSYLGITRRNIPKISGKMKFRNETCNCISMKVFLLGMCEYVLYKGALLSTGNKFNKFTINPGMFSGKFIKQIRPHLDIKKDPELLFKLRGKNKKIENIIQKWEMGYYTKPGESPYMKDIGREWMEEMDIIKVKKSKKNTSNAMLWRVNERQPRKKVHEYQDKTTS